MRTVIYTRCSTTEQDTQNQVHDLLLRFPGAEVVEEYASGAKSRPLLEQLLQELTVGDKLIVAGFDRISRSLMDFVTKMKYLNEKGVVFVSVREGVDYSTPAGRLVANIMSSLYEFEREVIVDRIKTALRAKKAAGVHLGRKFSIPQKKWDAAKALRDAGKTFREIEKELDISRSRLSEYFREVK